MEKTEVYCGLPGRAGHGTLRASKMQGDAEHACGTGTAQCKDRGENLRLGAEARELTSEEELCYLILVSGGSCNVQWDGQTTLAAPGCALLLGPGSGRLQQAGSVPPELLGCRFPVAVLHDIRNTAQRDYSALFEPGQATLLYGPVQWSSCLRTVLELMRKARGEQDYPGMLYLGLLLHYAEQEYRAESHAARPRNETVEQICAYLAANYQQKFSLSEVAAKFYISPYYLSRLFRRVTGQSIVDYINGRRIEAAQKLLETTELSIGTVAEQTGFASAAHFRRVFRETMGTGPLQYRKSHRT